MVASAEEVDTVGYTLKGNRYLNLTNRCGMLRCAFCPKFNGAWSVKEYNMRLQHNPSIEELVEAAGEPGEYNEVVFCGMGESTTRLDVMLEVARRLRAKGITKLRLNTNGLANQMYSRDVAPEIAALIPTISVSLNAQDEETYIRHCRPKFPGAYDSMLGFIKSAHEAGADVTVTAVDGLPGVDVKACAAIAEKLGVKFRRRVLDDLV